MGVGAAMEVGAVLGGYSQSGQMGSCLHPRANGCLKLSCPGKNLGDDDGAK